MISTTPKILPQSWLQSLNPIAALGIDGVALRQAYCCFRHDPAQGIQHVIRAARGSAWQHWVEARWARQAAALQDAVITIDLEALLQLPADTLGGAYARHMVANGFDPQAFVTADDSRETWVNRRAALAHDVHHIITGFDATPIGEYGLAGFSLVQHWNLLNVFVLTFLPFFALSDVRSTPKLLTTTLKGIWLGLTCRPIFAYPFEANWHKPLSEVRRALGID